MGEDTFTQRSGRNPSHVQKYSTKNNPTITSLRSRSIRCSGKFSRTFEDGRCRNKCVKIRATWTPRHKYKAGEISDHVRQLLKNGESAVHIISELVLRLEREIAESSSDNYRNEKYIIEEPEEWRLFYSLTSIADDDDIKYEETGKDWYTNYSFSIVHDHNYSPSSHNTNLTSIGQDF